MYLHQFRHLPALPQTHQLQHHVTYSCSQQSGAGRELGYSDEKKSATSSKGSEAKPHEETEIVPRPRSSRAPSSAPFVITRENALELRAKYGVKNLAKQLMDQYKTKRERDTAVVDTMALVAEQTEVLDEMISRFWEEYMVREQLWQGQGGEKAAKIVVDFEGVVILAQAKC